MPTKTTDPAKLRQQADDLARQAAEARALVDAASDAAYAQELQAQTVRDQAFLAAYSVRELDQHVADSLTALQDAIRDWPVTQALAAHLTAINSRSWAYADAIQVAGRLGRPTTGMRVPETTQPDLVDVIAAVAQRMAQDATDTARANQEN